MIGSLKTIKTYLHKKKIHDFNTLKDIIDFRNSYSIFRQQVIAHHEQLIEQERNMLDAYLPQLEISIDVQKQQSEQQRMEEIDRLKQQLLFLKTASRTNLIQRLTNDLKQWNYKRKIKQKYRYFYDGVNKSVKKLVEIQQAKSHRYQFIISQFNDAVMQSARYTLSELERRKTAIDELSDFISGALGEQKVVKTLEALSDKYFLINDFAVSFSPPLYNRQENEYIQSLQVDHILVGPTGVFLIETKNWSEKSLENTNLRSPVQQIRRAGYVLFLLLNNKMSRYQLHLGKHHWGDKKVSIRNLIVLINTKPKEEFQYVKILTLNELIGYVTFFNPIFSSMETQKIAEFLINVNNQRTIMTDRN